MNSIDPLSSSLFFSATAAATRDSKEKDKVKEKKKSSFASMVEKNQEIEALVSAGLPAEIAGLSMEDSVVFLKDQIDSSADVLNSDFNAENFAKFRKSIAQFMKYVSRNNYEIIKRKRPGKPVLVKGVSNVFFSEKRDRDPLVQVKVVDQKLDELASMILQNYGDKLKMMSKVNEIKGLIVDFLAV